MKKLFLPAFLLLLLLALLSLRYISDQDTGNGLPPNRTFIGCAPPANPADIRPGADGKYAPVFPGWGSHHYRIRTDNDSAQFYFDQGLNMYYSYHLTEALASFKEAARHDPGCAMAYWGQALSMGPYYNNYFYRMPAAVLPALEQMNRALAAGTEKERDLGEAMNKRYAPDTADTQRKALNRAYAEHLSALIKKYPADPDIKALYIDAVMLEHTWDFWKTDGAPKPWTPELLAYCDEVLQASPAHPAALHYQIHLVEASHHPEKALQNADLLKRSLPGVAHMVHMSSHMYQRNGLYARGIEVNEQAARLQTGYDAMAPHLQIGTFSLTHFNAVGAFCAMNANMFGKSLQMSQRLRDMLSGPYSPRLSSTFFQYLYMMPVFACIRSGRWQDLMALPAPDSSLPYALLLHHFGQGLACLRLHDSAAARRHLERLRALSKDRSLQFRNLPFNRAQDGAEIAEGILAAELLAAAGRVDEAAPVLEKAALQEDSLIYREPKEWPIPVRHFLGALLLKHNRAAAAENVYRQDLLLNPGNGWALLGLHQSLLQQGKTKEAETYRKAYTKAFADAEALPAASVY